MTVTSFAELIRISSLAENKKRNPFSSDMKMYASIRLLFLKPLLIVILFSCAGLCIESDTIARNLTIEYPDTIVSSGKVYRLGFFSPENTTNRYLGVWNNVSSTSIVWVANREKPLVNNSSGTLTISEDRNLVLTNAEKEIIWSSSVVNSSRNTSAQLLDSGNLVLRDNANGRVLWESFRHPADCFLPTMKITDNVITGEKVLLSSWKTLSDPSPGDFVSGLQASIIPQIFIWLANPRRPHWRSGPWNGLILTGVTDMYAVYLDGYSITRQSDGTVSFTRDYYLNLLMKIILKPNGTFIQTMWDVNRKDWNVTWVAPIDECDVYNVCGDFASCNLRNSPRCTCLKGYEPMRKDEWDNGNYSSGCVRMVMLQCERSDNSSDKGREDKFSKLPNVKVPDFIEVSPSVRDECERMCLRNCSCIAYSHDSGIGCMFWNSSLVDIREYPTGGSDLYVRVAYSVIDEKRDMKLIIIIPVVVGLAVILICIAILSWLMRNKKKDKKRMGKKPRHEPGESYPSDSNPIVLIDDVDEVSIDELPLYSFKMLANATDQFSSANLLGKGGFGPVYKGKLADGKVVAVKRLSRDSGQGLKEFTNEVLVISKLQHRNLVSLIGCCVEREEKMLIYEFMSNKSLDVFLFDPSERILDWKKRFDIIQGIGRGLMYLHRDSRLRIIHRDLKPSNVLLDENWNPKISDFGMARIFGAIEHQANTARVVGTYGYMAPEYAMGGRFSEKSDVFSFGVIVLEIISGRKNTSFGDDDVASNLLEYAWKLWIEGKYEDVIDQRILNSSSYDEVVWCVHIGLLCAQELPGNRPAISTVVSMLCNEIIDLPSPGKPAFMLQDRRGVSSSSKETVVSSNDVTITVLEGR